MMSGSGADDAHDQWAANSNNKRKRDLDEDIARASRAADDDDTQDPELDMYSPPILRADIEEHGFVIKGLQKKVERLEKQVSEALALVQAAGVKVEEAESHIDSLQFFIDVIIKFLKQTHNVPRTVDLLNALIKQKDAIDAGGEAVVDVVGGVEESHESRGSHE